jgi:hypothetical protein
MATGRTGIKKHVLLVSNFSQSLKGCMAIQGLLMILQDIVLPQFQSDHHISDRNANLLLSSQSSILLNSIFSVLALPD